MNKITAQVETVLKVFLAAVVLQTAANHPGVVTSGCKVTYS